MHITKEAGNATDTMLLLAKSLKKGQNFLQCKGNANAFEDTIEQNEQKDVTVTFKISEDGAVVLHETEKKDAASDKGFVSKMMRTSEELFEWQEQQAKEQEKEWNKTHLSWVEQWNKEHPNLVGVRCIRDSDGRWYTAEEINVRWNRELRSDGNIFLCTKMQDIQ